MSRKQTENKESIIGSDMILSIESEFDILGIDEHDHHHEGMLMSNLHDDEKVERGNKNNNPSSIGSTESSSTAGDDHNSLDIARFPVKTSPSRPSGKTKEEAGMPGKLDVLCGQSRSCAAHSGNKRFQALLDLYAPKYDAVVNKQDKMSMTKEVVANIKESGGRFLKQKSGSWQEISDVAARDKVSHALRTKVASWKRQKDDKSTDTSPSKQGGRSMLTHRRKRSGNSTKHRRRVSDSSATTSSSDIPNNSFDGSDPSSKALIDDLLKTQREIFANLQKGNGAPKEIMHPLKRTST